MDESTLNALLRSIPSVDRILSDPAMAPLFDTYRQDIVKQAVRFSLDQLRREIRSGSAGEADCEVSEVARRVHRRIAKRVGPKLTTLINATGVIVHTNLGRSPLSERVMERISSVAMSYSNLEFDLEKGQRGERNSHLSAAMEELTGAEAALAVNNNAAAVLLALSSLAEGREVIVSNGELIEIGGSFRVPDVMARSGAILRAVGTTNRTHAKDYRQAVNENTALILKVHPSNYRIVGFTREVELVELAEIGRETGIPTMMDLGSGCLVDLSAHGLHEETTVQEVLEKGIDVVSFSGDKLLGGPQAGILAGRAGLIEKMRTNQLARALRLDKLTLAGLEATLEEYSLSQGPEHGIPTLNMIARSPDQLHQAAECLCSDLRGAIGDKAEITLEPGVGRVGGGALPMGDLPGPRVAVRPNAISAGRLEQNIRAGNPPVIALVHENALLMDPRTLLHDQARLIPDLLKKALE